MASSGQVVGGQYMNSTVDTNRKGDLVVQVGFRGRKLDDVEVVTWQEVVPEPRSNIAAKFGQAVAGAALPGFVGKAASAAVGAGVEAANSSRLVRVEWSDGKRSLIKFPQKLFTHLSVLLENRRVEPVAEVSTGIVPAEVPLNATGQIIEQTGQVIEQTGRVVSDIVDRIKDRRGGSVELESAAQPDIAEQLVKLANLRDQGILTEEEFSAKKADLLSRL